MSEQDKSYEESIGSDIFNMITSAKQSGLDLDNGFQNEPLSTPKMTIRYLFYGKKALTALPMPNDVKKQLRTANVLGMIEVNGKPVGIHLICVFAKPFGDVASEQESIAALQPKGLTAFATQLKQVMADEFKQAEQDAQSGDKTVH
ncbi:hypothetical protein [Desulfovibrio ferrophilus]|uniref:Uncharacterized protein n=1 Tax=Desulfovibrio ferrophilus TaxID=241368 RepID=A0A2Z6B1L9_9BACT|nr:hypothetical protein [Desulfovibrio ferrophilus]BBD09365.1 uncharacterized protein DFE_2639 [Desulfovibrio ferrophilus]